MEAFIQRENEHLDSHRVPARTLLASGRGTPPPAHMMRQFACIASDTGTLLGAQAALPDLYSSTNTVLSLRLNADEHEPPYRVLTRPLSLDAMRARATCRDGAMSEDEFVARLDAHLAEVAEAHATGRRRSAGGGGDGAAGGAGAWQSDPVFVRSVAAVDTGTYPLFRHFAELVALQSAVARGRARVMAADAAFREQNPEHQQEQQTQAQQQQPQQQQENKFRSRYDQPSHAVWAPSCATNCQAGVSRSSSIVIAFLLRASGSTSEGDLDFIINEVQAKRTVVYPNVGFRAQLRRYVEFGFAPLTDSRLLVRHVISQNSNNNNNNEEEAIDSFLNRLFNNCLIRCSEFRGEGNLDFFEILQQLPPRADGGRRRFNVFKALVEDVFPDLFEAPSSPTSVSTIVQLSVAGGGAAGAAITTAETPTATTDNNHPSSAAARATLTAQRHQRNDALMRPHDYDYTVRAWHNFCERQCAIEPDLVRELYPANRCSLSSSSSFLLPNYSFSDSVLHYAIFKQHAEHVSSKNFARNALGILRLHAAVHPQLILPSSSSSSSSGDANEEDDKGASSSSSASSRFRKLAQFARCFRASFAIAPLCVAGTSVSYWCDVVDFIETNAHVHSHQQHCNLVGNLLRQPLSAFATNNIGTDALLGIMNQVIPTAPVFERAARAAAPPPPHDVEIDCFVFLARSRAFLREQSENENEENNNTNYLETALREWLAQQKQQQQQQSQDEENLEIDAYLLEKVTGALFAHCLVLSPALRAPQRAAGAVLAPVIESAMTCALSADFLRGVFSSFSPSGGGVSLKVRTADEWLRRLGLRFVEGVGLTGA